MVSRGAQLCGSKPRSFSPGSVDSGNDVAEILKRVNVLQTAGVDERVEHGGTPCCIMRAREEIVLSSERNGSHLIFNAVVVELVLTVSKNSVLLNLRSVQSCGEALSRRRFAELATLRSRIFVNRTPLQSAFRRFF